MHGVNLSFHCSILRVKPFGNFFTRVLFWQCYPSCMKRKLSHQYLPTYFVFFLQMVLKRPKFFTWPPRREMMSLWVCAGGQLGFQRQTIPMGHSKANWSFEGLNLTCSSPCKELQSAGRTSGEIQLIATPESSAVLSCLDKLIYIPLVSRKLSGHGWSPT